MLTMGFVDVVRTPTTGVDLLDKGLRKLGLQTKENFDGLVTFVFDKEGSIVYTQYSAFPSGVDIQGVVKSGGKTYAYGGYKGEEFREYLGEYMLEKADWTAVEAMNYVPVSQ